MEHTSAFAASILEQRCRRDRLLPGATLVTVTTVVNIFAEKTLPDRHHSVRPLGFPVMVGMVAPLGFSLLGGTGSRRHAASLGK